MFYTDVGEMVDHSTQTPRDENSNKPIEMDVDGENAAASADSGPGESKQGRIVLSGLRSTKMSSVRYISLGVWYYILHKIWIRNEEGLLLPYV